MSTGLRVVVGLILILVGIVIISARVALARANQDSSPLMDLKMGKAGWKLAVLQQVLAGLFVIGFGIALLLAIP